MTTLIILPLLSIVIYFITLFITDKLSKVFIARVALILFFILSGSYHLKNVLTMSDLTPGATEMFRNALYFTGIFQIVLAFGLVFTKSLKWTSIVLIVFLVILISLNLFGIFSEFNFIGRKGLNESTPWMILEYLGLIIWTYLFGIHFKHSRGVIGWIENGKRKVENGK